MIDRTLPPIDLPSEPGFDEAAQALAFTWLAYTNQEPLQPATFNSYKRAYAFDEYYVFPRKTNGTPGFLVLLWTTGGHRRMLIAVEGTTSAGQLANLSTATGWTSRVGVLGYVMANFKTKADDIYAQIAAHPEANAAFTNARTIVTWTGHSLGAAIADINAVRQKTANMAMHVRLIKFGSPCVGNDSYVGNNQNLLPRANYYVGKDPCFLLPTAEVRLLSIALTLLDSGPVSEGICWRFDVPSYDQIVSFYRHGLTYSRLHVAADSLASMNPLNPWYDHLMGSYRLAWMNVARRIGGLTFYRFNYLENNYENVWQLHGNAGATDWQNWNVLDVTVDIQQAPPTAQIEQQSIPFRARAPIGDDDFVFDENSGEWSSASIPPPALNADPAPLMQPLAGNVADFGIPVPPSRVSELRQRRIRLVGR